MTLSSEDFRLLNTVYIMSKGRPQCRTARTLIAMNYPGEWFIVCGNNDETIPEYQKNFGKERVLVFDWYEQIKHTDVLDNFGFEKMPSGAVPARNAIIEISRQRGELRHWQFDDDYEEFWLTNLNRKGKRGSKCPQPKKRLTGKTFQWWLCRIAKFGYDTNMPNVGFSQTTAESMPDNCEKVGKRIFNAHNQSSTGGATVWRSRLNDDTINAIDTYHRPGKIEFSFKFLNMSMKLTQQEKGGLQDIYQKEGTIRKTAYLFLVAPNAAKLVIKFGRYHHSVDWPKLVPKIVSEKWRRT